jgi:hypothetical protein
MFMSVHLLSFWLSLALILSVPLTVSAQMSSTNYQILWDTTSEGGDEMGTSTNYQVRDTIGGTAVGLGSSASYSLTAGYRLSDSSALSFTMKMASPSFTPIGYQVFSDVQKFVMVNNAADLATLAVGDMIAAIEGSGFSQSVVVGKVTRISDVLVYVDQWSGSLANMSSSPTSGTASVVKLGTTSVALGTVGASTAAIATGYIGIEAPSINGYIVYAQAGSPPSNGTHTLTPVTDGAVTVGSEEYGLRTLGSQASLVADTGVTSTAVQIQASTDPSGSPQDRSVLLYKLAVSSSTPAGSYGQSVFFTLTPRY